jgi:arrestin-related trafficking adapter 4/5/7
MFGTRIQIDFEISPLVKGLRIGSIDLQLVQMVKLTLQKTNRQESYGYTVSSETEDFPDDAESEDIHGLEGWRFTRYLQIPTSLTKCCQTVNARGIKVRHRVVFDVSLKNPDGHTSQVREKKLGFVQCG